MSRIAVSADDVDLMTTAKPGGVVNVAVPPKRNGDDAACELAALLDRFLDIDVDAITLRLFILAHWRKVSKLAHEIHEDRD